MSELSNNLKKMKRNLELIWTTDITGSNLPDDGGLRTIDDSAWPVAVVAGDDGDRRQVRDAPASTRLISSVPGPPGLWVSDPVAGVGCPVAVAAAVAATTGCYPSGTLCPSVSTIPTGNSAKTS